MKISQSLLLALSLIHNAWSAPTPGQPQPNSKSFKVERVRRGGGTIHGPTALRRAYEKYGLVPGDLGINLDDLAPIIKHVNAKEDLSSSETEDLEQTGAVTAASVQNDAAFVSPVMVGGQKIVMNFDTGSSDFWVMSTRLPKSDQKDRTVFHPSNSTTFKQMKGSTFNISYGDTSFAYGGVGTDTVDIGGATVTRQAIGLPTSVSRSFTQDSYSNGLVGLGFSKLNTIKPSSQKTFFDNIAATLDQPVLTASLKSDDVGEYEFGVIDESKYRGEIANISIDSSSGFWRFDTASFAVGDEQLRSINDSTTAIADTGTSLMLLDQGVVDAYYAKVDGAVYHPSASGYVFPCTAELPSLTMAVGEKHYATVPGEYVHFAEIGVNRTTDETVCYGGIQSNQGNDFQILGDVFLKAFFAVFDLRGPSLGLAAPNY